MQRLSEARRSLKEEIAHARQGAEYYQRRVEALEQTLEQLERIDQDEPHSTTSRAKAGRKKAEGTYSTGAKKTSAKAAATKSSTAADLPSTGGDFWPGLITSEPISTGDLYKAAVAKLGMTPSKEQEKKLKFRMNSALNVLTAGGTIKSTGSGRERRYFK